MPDSKHKPEILSQEATENGVVLTLRVDEDIAYFQGHFSIYKLLPGITQIDWAYHYGTMLLPAPPVFNGLEVIKFYNPITPGSTVELTLKWKAERQKLEFVFQSEDGKHSSGRILLSE